MGAERVAGTPTDAVAAGDVSRATLFQGAAFTGIAMAAHNFVEAIAIYFGAHQDSSFGVSMAAAVAAHNIPEGLCVAMPILRGSGSPWWAFFWAFVCGLAEPLGAALAWSAFGDSLDPATSGIVFGISGGMMLHVAALRLLPDALKLDPANLYASHFFFAGMCLMAMTSVLHSHSDSHMDSTADSETHSTQMHSH